MTENLESRPFDPFTSPHVGTALYFTDQAQFIVRAKTKEGKIILKTLAEPDVRAAFTQKGFDTGWMEPGIMRMGSGTHGRWYVFFKQPTWKTITVDGVGKLLIPLPAMLMVSATKKFYLAALKTGLSGEYNLLQATYEVPLPNVHGRTGLICWGNIAVPSGDPKLADLAWKTFIESPFNHGLANTKSRQYPQDVTELLKTLDMEKDYPLDDLVARPSNVQEWVAAAIREDLE